MSSRPVTPRRRRPPTRLLLQSPKVHYPVDGASLPLESFLNLEKFARLSDLMDELYQNMTNLQQIHEVLSSNFNESFAAFMYGVSITMWCVDFPGCPSTTVWQQIQDNKEKQHRVENLKSRLERARLRNLDLRRRWLEVSRVEKKIIREPVKRNFIRENRLSKIPQRPRKQEVTVRGKVGPDLNQPPRYLRGLFDRSNVGGREFLKKKA